jgi:Molybdopterin oxidoreductase Fe4S4 domain
MASVEKVTFCRICEPCCGLVATVRDGRLEALRPDRDNPISASYSCPKGLSRSTCRTTPTASCTCCGGTFRRVSWETVLDPGGVEPASTASSRNIRSGLA